MSDKKEGFNGIEIGALWLNNGVLSGTFGNGRIAVLKNKYKGDNEKAPDYKIFVFPQEKREQQQKPKQQQPRAQQAEDFPF